MEPCQHKPIGVRSVLDQVYVELPIDSLIPFLLQLLLHQVVMLYMLLIVLE